MSFGMQMICFWWWWLLSTVSLIASVISPVAIGDSSLNGQHLNVYWSRKGGVFNESFYGSKKGGVMIEYLAKRFNFTYTYLSIGTNPTGRFQNQKIGTVFLIRYIFGEHWDVATEDVIILLPNYKLVEMIPCFFSRFEFLIALPDSSANINALLKPFQPQVWIILVAFTIFVILALTFTQRFTNLTLTLVSADATPGRFRINTHCQAYSTNISLDRSRFVGIAYLYAFGLLVFQGGPCVWRNLHSRIVAGVWCLAAFVIGQAYNSTLLIYIISPNNPPLIESVYDIVNNPGINFIVEKDQGFDRLISDNSDELGLTLQELGKKLNKFSRSRCENIKSCIALVKNGKMNVFGQPNEYALDAVIADYKETGRCEVQMAKESYLSFFAGWIFPKRTPYRNAFAIGLLEMEERGLMRNWDQWFRRVPSKCIENTRKVQNPVHHSRVNNPRLSLKNLTGAFIVLAVGYILAFLAYIIERMIQFHHEAKAKSSLISESTSLRQTSENDATVIPLLNLRVLILFRILWGLKGDSWMNANAILESVYSRQGRSAHGQQTSLLL